MIPIRNTVAVYSFIENLVLWVRIFTSKGDRMPSIKKFNAI